MGVTAQHFHTIPTSCGVLLPLTQYALFVSCVHRGVVEGGGEGSAGCVVHVDVQGEWVMLWVTAI